MADKQLQKEILYDMQKHDAAMARARVAAAAAAIPIHREVLQQVSPSLAQTPANSIPVSATEKHVSKEAEDRAQQQPKRTIGGKENGDPCHDISSNTSPQPASRNARHNASKGSDILTRTPAFSSLRRSAVDSFREGDSRTGPSPRVAWPLLTPRVNVHSTTPGSIWRPQSNESHQTPFRPPHPNCSRLQQQTPRMTIHSATPGSLSRLQSHESHQTPFGPPHPNCSRFLTPRRPAGNTASPSCASLEETCLAGAVAEVAAASTVATVLQQVAQRSVTPFKAMSIPRLRPDISSISAALRQQSAISSQGEILVGDRSDRSCSDGGDGLETVRRRQSFSSVEEPCGVLSQSNSD